MDISDFPSLTAEEFVEACHHLDRKYRQAKLGPLRMHWKLKVITQLAHESNFTTVDSPSTYIRITRSLDEGDDPYLDLDLSQLSISQTTNPPEADQEMMEMEASDEAALRNPAVRRDYGSASYYICLHPTYRMPCLWFCLNGISEDKYDLDTVFCRLVPNEYKDGLRRYGGVGGIGMDQSPLGPGPCFFVHPCLAADQMRAFGCECSREDYLIKWLGLAGGCVGLWIPKELMLIA